MSADVRTDFYPYMLCISDEHLTIDKRLRPRPDQGVQVVFRFGISEKVEGKPQHFVGLGDIWDASAGYETGESKDLPSCVELRDTRGQKFNSSDFPRKVKQWRELDFDFTRLCETFLGHEGTGSMEALICDKLLDDLLEYHYDVKAEIVPVANPDQPVQAEARVRFFEGSDEKLTYIFTLSHADTERLFRVS